MAPPADPKNQTSLDDEISLLDIIQFFKDHFKRILFFIILGGVLGYLYGKFADPIYQGSVLISPAKVAGTLVIDPKILLTELNMNSFYSKETFLSCNPSDFKDGDSNYDMSNIIKTSITKDGVVLKLSIDSSNKEMIHSCLESISNDISASQKIITDSLIEMKKIELNFIESKLRLGDEFRRQFISKRIKNSKTDELYAIALIINTFDTRTLLDQINKIKIELSPSYTKVSGQILPVDIKRKSFPSSKLSVLLGLFLGGILGFFVGLFKNMRIN